jgi:hypothetical protein
VAPSRLNRQAIITGSRRSFPAAFFYRKIANFGCNKICGGGGQSTPRTGCCSTSRRNLVVDLLQITQTAKVDKTSGYRATPRVAIGWSAS